jgi:Protein of unknown function (DUF2786)
MTENERDRVIERVRKLLALSANNPSEAEAAFAAAKAQAILIEHNLDMAEVKDAKIGEEEEDFEIIPVSETESKPWRRFLGAAVGELYFCKYFYTTTKRTDNAGRRAVRDVHTFVGARHNIAVCNMMFTYIHETVNRLAKDGAKKDSVVHPSKYRTTFRSAATTRLCQRIMEKIRQTKSGTLKTESGSNLPACLNLYEHAAAKAASMLAAMGTALTTKKTKMAVTDAHAYRDGYEVAGQTRSDCQTGPGRVRPG